MSGVARNCRLFEGAGPRILRFTMTNLPLFSSHIRAVILIAGSVIAVWPATAQGQGIPQRVEALEIQAVTLSEQIADLQQLIATLQQQAVTQGQIANVTAQIASLQPLNLTVDCNSGQTVGSALQQAGARTSRVTITVVGVCMEAVAISRNNTTLRSTTGGGLQAPSAQANVLSIGANDVTIAGLTLSGGRGVQINSRSNVSIVNSQVIGSAFHGVSIFSAVVDVRNSTVSGSAVVGIQAMSGSILRLHNSAVENNAFGVDVANGSFALLDGGTLVDGGGVSVSFGSNLQVGNATVTNSAGPGIQLTGGSVAHFGFGGGLGVIRDNASHGMLLRDTSVASSLFSGGAAQITDNGGLGVYCSGTPAVAQLVGHIGTVTGNTLGQTNCPVGQ